MRTQPINTPLGQRRARAFSRTLNREIDAGSEKSFRELLNRSIFHAPVIRFPCGKLPARTQDWRQTRKPAPWTIDGAVDREIAALA